MRDNGRRRAVWIATAAAMVALLGGWALAVSTTSTGPAQSSNITVTTPNGFTTASVGSTQVILLSSTVAAYPAAGTQAATTAALSGSTLTLTACATGPCTQNLVAVDGNTVTAGDYALQMVVDVTQPATGGTAAGFDVQAEVTINGGTLEFGNAYLSTGVSTAVTSQTVDVLLFVDLGTTTAPTLSSASIQFNSCLSASSCP